MSSPSDNPRHGFWKRLRKLGRSRSKSRNTSQKLSASDCLTTSTDSPRPLATIPAILTDEEARFESSPVDGVKKTPATNDNALECLPSHAVASDLWSAAYREAIENLGKDVDSAILQAESIAQLFRDLEDVDRDVMKESAFIRGVQHLHAVRVPLERFKLALDITAPLSGLEPTANIVVGVVRSVTAIAISLASADLDFAKQIGEMLEQISYIDGCDTLGQEMNKGDIHRALVVVYQKILEFYQAAYEILSRRGVRLVMQMVLENERLPNIVRDLLSHAETLRKLVERASLEIAMDIKKMLYDQETARILGDDKTARQGSHHAQLRELRADEACDHLLAEQVYLEWSSGAGPQQLMIFGDTGCGKTVLMSFLVDALNRKARTLVPRPKLCYYYCRDDETGRARTVLPALILSFLQQFAGLKKSFIEWYKQQQIDGVLDPVSDLDGLEDFFVDTLTTLDRPLYILIDGLDECDQSSRARLLRMVERCLQTAVRTKFIFSSRPEYEVVQGMAGMPQIDLSPNTQRDTIIVTKTVNGRLSHVGKGIRMLVIDKLSTFAQGSAIWVKMVVELICVRRIYTLDSMQRFLEDVPLPNELTKLYEALFFRSTSGDLYNERLLVSTLRLLSVARRPLGIGELASAVALCVAPEEVQSVADLSRRVDHRNIICLVQPFLNRLDHHDLHKRQVRLSHQSMKEFVLDRLPLHGEGNMHVTASMSRSEKMELLESLMLNVCVRYLLLQEIGHICLFTEAQMTMQQLPQTCDIFDSDALSSNDDDLDAFAQNDEQCTWDTWEENMMKYDPIDRGFGHFFVYASCDWIHHYSAVTHKNFPDLDDVETLCEAQSTRLYNWTQQNCRPNCTIQARFPFDADLYDPLSVTSLYGSEAMLSIMLKNADLTGKHYLSHSRTKAAEQIRQWGDQSRLHMLL